MDRITQKDLEAVVNRINAVTGNPETPWKPRESGQGMSANIGNYHLSGAYGGVSLHRMMSDGGGVEDVFRCGHMPKRKLYDKMQAWLDGWYANERARGAV